MSEDSLSTLRDDIDRIDEDIIALLAKRFVKTQAIGQIKLERDLPVSLPERVQHRAQLIRALARKYSMDPEAALAIYASINRETVVAHRRQGVKPNE
ncbi:chorismate mutase [Variovorax sp. OV329]|uniref:chorismate mutase n=1 Tax=Variovorax sp. OV329 TaxID=1882825 RepID=UPI0008E6A8F5|nr:chorismate mutase [Variovorax sp. OV329]SFM92599.1 chorismate mutase [Variovorax sp. OV329]